MPNWCSNNLTVSGPGNGIAFLQKAAEAEDFCNAVIPVPLELRMATAGSLPPEGPGQEKEIEARKNRLEKYGYENWYDFCTSKWGTKWDVGADKENISYRDDKPEGKGWVSNYWAQIQFSFESPWGPPIEIYKALLELGFDGEATYFEPGMDFAGIFSDSEDECFTLSDYNDEWFETDASGELLDAHYNIIENRAMWAEDDAEWEEREKETVNG